MEEKLKLKIIIGSTRPSRFSEKLAPWVEAQARARSEFEVEALDLRDYPMPFFNEVETPGYKSKPYAEPTVAKWTAKIGQGDAFVVITPEYNHGYPAVLKNAIDWVGPEWNKKPIGFVSYGSGMGARSVEQLRQVVIELQMAPIRPAIHLPIPVLMAAREAKASVPPEVFAPMNDAAKMFFDHLAWWGKALKEARAEA